MLLGDHCKSPFFVLLPLLLFSSVSCHSSRCRTLSNGVSGEEMFTKQRQRIFPPHLPVRKGENITVLIIPFFYFENFMYFLISSFLSCCQGWIINGQALTRTILKSNFSFSLPFPLSLPFSLRCVRARVHLKDVYSPTCKRIHQSLHR